MRLRKFWGWGYDDELLSSEEENNIDQRIAKTFQLDQVERIEIPKISDIDINKLYVLNDNLMDVQKSISDDDNMIDVETNDKGDNVNADLSEENDESEILFKI